MHSIIKRFLTPLLNERGVWNIKYPGPQPDRADMTREQYLNSTFGQANPQFAGRYLSTSTPGGAFGTAGGGGGGAGASGAGGGGGTGTSSEQNIYGSFKTSGPGPDYGNLISQYQNTLAGGTGSFQQLADYGRQQGLEATQNALSSRGLSARSGIGAAGAAQFLKGYEPQAAAMQANYIKELLGGYTGAVAQGRETFQPTLTSQQRTSTGAGGGGGSGVGPYWQGQVPQTIPSSSGGGGTIQGTGGQWVGGSFIPGLSGYGTSYEQRR